MVDGSCRSPTRCLGGTRRDSTTVAEVIGDLRKRFGLGDRGMKSAGSLAALEREGLGYLMGVQGRRNPEMEAALQAMGEEAWEACVGSDGTAKTNGSIIGKQEVTREGGRGTALSGAFAGTGGSRCGGCGRRRQEKVREGPAAEGAGGGGRVSEAGEREPHGGKDEAGWIGEAAGKILGSRHGQRYYDWRLDEDGQLEYFENANCAKEKRREGHWLLETEETGFSAVEAVRAYQELWRVEAAFRTMKDVLELRPVWHQTPQRVQAHVLVASLARTFDRILQRKLEPGLKLSSQAAWRALEAVNLVEFTMEGREPKAGVCINGEEGAPGNEARRVLRALGIRPQAPQPPANGDRIVY